MSFRLLGWEGEVGIDRRVEDGGPAVVPASTLEKSNHLD